MTEDELLKEFLEVTGCDKNLIGSVHRITKIATSDKEIISNVEGLAVYFNDISFHGIPITYFHREITRPKGHWIQHKDTNGKKYRECYRCKTWFEWDMPRNSFCPNCGTDMRYKEE